MKRFLHYLWEIFGIVIGVWVSWDGLAEFNDAVNGIQLTRGLFWLVIGMWCFILSLRGLVKLIEGDK